VRRSKILLAVLFLTLPHVFAEELQLKDGTKITGKVISVKDDTFEVKTSYGNINVPRTDVVSIAFPENQPAVASANKQTPVAESLIGTAYINRTAGFRITTPTGWSIAPEMRNKDIVAALKSADNTLFFLVTTEPFAGNLATYKVLAETQYKSKFTDYEKVSESEVEIDGRQGTRLVFHGKMDKTTTWSWSVYILPYEGRMVRISFMTIEPLFNDAVPVFERMASSYHALTTANLAQR
jgi:hypothetical protein